MLRLQGDYPITVDQMLGFVSFADMSAKSKIAPFVFLLALIFSATTGLTGSQEQEERIDVAFVIALGKKPTVEEASKWTEQGELSLATLLAGLDKRLAENASLRSDVFTRAFQDAFGRSPNKAEAKAGSNETANYTKQMQKHIRNLSENTGEYESAIRRAYQFVIRREAYDEEISYWKERGTLSYVLLVGCVEDWARRNQPGLMVTAGTPTISVNSVYLETIRLSVKVAEEARAATGFNAISEPGKHLLAAGAENIVTGGRVHFAVAGASSRDS